jgi:hypothetical protein
MRKVCHKLLNDHCISPRSWHINVHACKALCLIHALGGASFWNSRLPVHPQLAHAGKYAYVKEDIWHSHTVGRQRPLDRSGQSVMIITSNTVPCRLMGWLYFSNDTRITYPRWSAQSVSFAYRTRVQI